MSKKLQFAAEIRERAGKGMARALRRGKRVPAVIYGDGKPPVSISVDEPEITKVYYKGQMFNHLSEITVNGETHLTLARDVQVNVISDHIIHADFLRVTPKTRIAVKIPLHFANEDSCPGINNGGTLLAQSYDVELYCRATNIPEALEIDLSAFDIGDSIMLSSVTLPEGTESAASEDVYLAAIAAPRVVAADDDAEEEGAADAEAEADGEAEGDADAEGGAAE